MSAYNTKNHPLLFYHQREIKKIIEACVFQFQFLSFSKQKDQKHTRRKTFNEMISPIQRIMREKYNVRTFSSRYILSKQ